MKKIIYIFLVVLMLAAILCGCQQDATADAQGCQHTNQEVVGVITATCTAKGYSGDTKCTDCGAVVKNGDEVAMLEHQIVTEGAVPATCLTSGKSGVGTCTVCNAVVFEDTEVPPTGHTETTVNAVEATCTAKGYSGDVVCGVCNERIRTGEEVPQAEHNTMLEGFLAATCSAEGYSGDEVCKDCNTVISKGTVTSAAHNPVTKGYKAATCTTEGATGETSCSDCGKILENNTKIPKTAHNVSIKGKKSATCTSTGYTGDEVCTVCGVTVKTGTSIAKKEHNPVTKNAKAASCVDGYSGDVYCSYCNMKISDGYVLPATQEHETCLMNRVHATTEREGYSGDIVCEVCKTVTEYGHVTDKLPIQPDYEHFPELEAEMLELFNNARAEQGVHVLQWDSVVHAAAYNRVREYVWWLENQPHPWPHHRPDGSPFDTALYDVGVSYTHKAENLTGGLTLEDMFMGWMNSTLGHREAILNSDFTYVSICIIRVENIYYAVAIFHNNVPSPLPLYMQK